MNTNTPTSSPTPAGATSPATVHVLNAQLGQRVERSAAGFDVINGWGYIGKFPTLAAALAAHADSNRPAPSTPENPDGI